MLLRAGTASTAEGFRRQETAQSVCSSSTTATTIDVGVVIGNISSFLKSKGLRVLDLFRSPQYNPGYLQRRDERLGASQVQEVLAKAGLELSRPECKNLIRWLTQERGGERGDALDLRDLEAAVRQHRRGKTEWDQSDEGSPSPSTRKERASRSYSLLNPGIVMHPGEVVMDAISDLLDQQHIRIADVFRLPGSNVQQTQGTAEELRLSASEILEVLQKAGLDLTIHQVREMVECADPYGTLSVPDLEGLIRAHRRGNVDWLALSAQRAAEKKEKKAVNMDYLKGLSDQHRLRQDVLRAKRQKREVEEDDRIEQGREANRVGTRANISEGELDPQSGTERLYNHHRELEQRRLERALKLETQEQMKIESSRHRPMTRSTPDLTRTDEVNKLYGTSFRNIGERLHAARAAKEDELRCIRMQEEALLLDQMDVISRRAEERGDASRARHEKLYQDAHDRRRRLERSMEADRKVAEAEMQKRIVGHGRKKLTIQEIQTGRIAELHSEAVPREKRRQKLAQAQQERELQEISARAQEGRSKLASVQSKFRQAGSPRSCSPSGSPRSPGAKSPLAFGSAVRRGCLAMDQDPSTKWCIAPADHALSMVNSVLASRCNASPCDGQMEVLSDMVEPLELAMQEYREARHESEQGGEGVIQLRKMESSRLFATGNLLEDPAGWHQCCEPDPLRQLVEDFDDLLAAAQQAQTVLLAAVGPEPGLDPEQIKRRWPTGSKWNHPHATRKAQFAYNPGPKSRERASAKAFVRYGPSQRENRYRHLTDLARCSLVFADAHMLRAGLEQIIERFEVIDVRNYYHASYQNLLGLRFVEVLIVVKCPNPFVCELRLEEMSFYIARERAQPHVEEVAQGLADLYTCAGAKASAIKYLAEWTLVKPKESHATTVFRKHLARRFGSTIATWRRALGNGPLAPYRKFREACQEVGQRHRTVEFWQELDATRAGCISLFELDPEAVVLLTKFHWRILGLLPREQLQDPEQVFAKLTSKSILKVNRPGQLEAHEFRRVMKVLGFSASQSDRVFGFLDSHGGEGHTPPATVLPSDLAWLGRLPRLVDVGAVMLHDEAHSTDMESLRTLSYSGRAHANECRRARSPGIVGGRLSALPGQPRGSGVSSATAGTLGSLGTVLARRSVSSSPPPARRGSMLSVGSNYKPPTARDDFLNSLRLQLPLPDQAEQQAEAGGYSGPIEETPEDVVSPGNSMKDPAGDDAAPALVPAVPDTAAAASRPQPRSSCSSSGASSAAPLDFRPGDEVTVAEAFLSDSARPVRLRKGLAGRVAEVSAGSGALTIQFLSIAAPQKVSAANVPKLVLRPAGGTPVAEKGREAPRGARSGAAALVPRINIQGMERKATDGGDAPAGQPTAPKDAPEPKAAEAKEPKRVAAMEERAKMAEPVAKLEAGGGAGARRGSDADAAKHLKNFLGEDSEEEEEEEETF